MGRRDGHGHIPSCAVGQSAVAVPDPCGACVDVAREEHQEQAAVVGRAVDGIACLVVQSIAFDPAALDTPTRFDDSPLLSQCRFAFSGSYECCGLSRRQVGKPMTGVTVSGLPSAFMATIVIGSGVLGDRARHAGGTERPAIVELDTLAQHEGSFAGRRPGRAGD